MAQQLFLQNSLTYAPSFDASSISFRSIYVPVLCEGRPRPLSLFKWR